MCCRDDQCGGGSDHYGDGVQLSNTFLVFTAYRFKKIFPIVFCPDDQCDGGIDNQHLPNVHNSMSKLQTIFITIIITNTTIFTTFGSFERVGK